MRLFGIKVSRLEAIDGDGVIVAIDGNSEVFVGAVDYWIRAVVGWL